ncbi:MAG: type II secretion system protein [Candidatus Wallbacteria bacterium]|nr:type II secretion system protein [Candidatus Wallbacteria bacterium]
MRARRDLRGITLLELMMAIAILSFALLPLSMVMRSGSKTVEGTRDIAGAVCFAQATLEQCRSYPYELLRREPGTPAGEETAEEAMKRAATFTMGRITYTRQVTIRPVSAGSGFDGRLMHLRITWQPKDGEKPFEYETWSVFSDVK